MIWKDKQISQLSLQGDKMTIWKTGKFAVTILIAMMILGDFTVYAHSWIERPFRIESEDKSKVFIFNPLLPNYPHAPVYRYPEHPRLAVYYNTEPLQLIYTVNTPDRRSTEAPFSERDVVISECFRYIVFIPPRTWAEGTALEFYENGVLLRRYIVSDLVRHTDTLPFSWLFYSIVWEESRVFNSGNNRLSIRTFDGIFPLDSTPMIGRTFVFDITTGEIVARSPRIPIPIGSLFICVVILSSIHIHKKRKLMEQISAEANLPG